MSSSSNSSSRERLRAVFVDAGQQLMLLARRVHTASQERVLGAASHFAQHADATLDTSFQHMGSLGKHLSDLESKVHTLLRNLKGVDTIVEMLR